jgi:hypothetical protein
VKKLLLIYTLDCGKLNFYRESIKIFSKKKYTKIEHLYFYTFIFPSFILQMLFASLVLWHNIRNFFPKFMRVIHLTEMTEFVNNNIINTFSRSHDKTIGKVESFFTTTTPPASYSGSNANSLVLKSMFSCECFTTRDNIVFCLRFVEFYKFCGISSPLY